MAYRTKIKEEAHSIDKSNHFWALFTGIGVTIFVLLAVFILATSAPSYSIMAPIGNW